MYWMRTSEHKIQPCTTESRRIEFSILNQRIRAISRSLSFNACIAHPEEINRMRLITITNVRIIEKVARLSLRRSRPLFKLHLESTKDAGSPVCCHQPLLLTGWSSNLISRSLYHGSRKKGHKRSLSFVFNICVSKFGSDQIQHTSGRI